MRDSISISEVVWQYDSPVDRPQVWLQDVLCPTMGKKLYQRQQVRGVSDEMAFLSN